MFFSLSLPSLLYPDNILFQLYPFLMEGSGVCCPTLIHTLNTTSIIRLRVLRCTLIRAPPPHPPPPHPLSSAFNFLPLMLFVLFFSSKEGFELHGALSFCVSLGVSHSHLCPECSGSSPQHQRLKSHTCSCLKAAFILCSKC